MNDESGRMNEEQSVMVLDGTVLDRDDDFNVTGLVSSLISHPLSFDETMMQRALKLAAQGVGRVSPSPLVGCVITDTDNNIVGEGSYIYENVTHAEVLALAQARERARGGTAYVSLEPHAHHGRTPPCTEALMNAGIKRVVAPIEDPNPLVSGRGFEILRAGAVEVTTGVLAEEAARQNEKFICAMRNKRPFVHLKMAGSLDGRIDFGARVEQAIEPEIGTPLNPDERAKTFVTYLSNSRARRRVHELRHEYDAIAVGANTVRRDNPQLTDRSNLARRRPLVRVVFDERLSISLDSELVLTASKQSPTIIFAHEACSETERYRKLIERGVEVELLPSGTRDLNQLLAKLYQRQLHSLLLEGGAQIASSFINAGLVDKVSFFIAPLLIGNSHATSAVSDLLAPLRLTDVTHRMHDTDIEVTGYPQP